MITKRLVISSALFFLTVGLTHADDSTLKSLSDSELSQVQGQALMNLTYTDPSKANASMASQNIGFYKLGMEADVELNANIKKLQLGCGGVNGAGGCDIDIDNLSLSGLAETREGRVGSSAKMTNPFIEFAIKNPNSASTREMMGFRLSAEKVLGMLTLGEENTGTPNGINTLSGYLNIKETTGTAKTGIRNMQYGDTNMEIKGRLKTFALIPWTPSFSTQNYNLRLNSADAHMSLNQKVLSGTRMESADLTGSAKIDPLSFSGSIVPTIIGLTIPINISVDGSISGLTADVKIKEDLGFIHRLELNNPFSLSLQKQSIHWNGASVAANKGWWLAIEDQVDIGHVVPQNPIAITNDVLKQVVPKLNDYLAKSENTVQCTWGSCLAGINLPVNLTGSKPLDFPVSNLQLATQNFAPNCYGSLKFC